MDGSYTVLFRGMAAEAGFGTGVVHVDQGRLRGGDTGFSYYGEVNLLDDGRHLAIVNVVRHNTSENYPSVTGMNTFKFEAWISKNGDAFNFKGHISDSPEVIIEGVLKSFDPIVYV